MDCTDKLVALRAQLARHKVGAFLIPSNDAFQGEYVPEAAQRLKYITGFSGSAGFAVVHKTKAAFFTDGRYTLQAAQEVPAIFARHNTAEISPAEWVLRNLPKAVIGCDATLFSVKQKRIWEQKGIALQNVPNVVDAIWKNRPSYNTAPAFPMPLAYAGESTASKITRVVKAMEADADALFIAAPDALSWLLNVRAADVPFTPFLNATALLFRSGAVQLFVSPEKIPPALKKIWGKKVSILAAPQFQKGTRIQLDAAQCNCWWAEKLHQAGAKIVEATDPIQLLKACKNPVEQQGMRQAHIKDGAAMAQFLCWLDGAWKKGGVTEISAAEKLLSFRKKQEGFREPSFATIAGMNAHGAIVHYHATPKTDARLVPGIFLLDSGGQYWEGTTDITRTLALGAPKKAQAEDFTRVLKGHIALARAVFPKGVTGAELDVLARMPLWQSGQDYDHGTGHGVSSYLSVHEGPQSISRRAGSVALKPGMVLSNEPGFYKEGAYGIRIENLVLVVASSCGRQSRSAGSPDTAQALRASQHDKEFYGFETLTLAPMDRRLIVVAMLSEEERAWLDAYHARVLKTLSPRVDKKTGAWLKEMCKKL